MNQNPRHITRQAEARRRFKQLMVIMTLATAVVLVGAFTWLLSVGVAISIHLVLSVGVAVVGSMALAAALMGLVFFSNTSGVDEEQDMSNPDRRG